MPGAGQATVVVTGPAIARTDPRYYAGLVANAVLGGGYSARLNEEIRVKRGLSYGASSSLTARRDMGAFTAQVQTRNETAAEVIGLIKAQMSAVAAAPPTADELAARKASLVGDYGRALGTTAGLAADLGDLALYGLDLNEIGAYTGKVQAVTGAEAQGFAAQVLTPDHASVIIAGDPDGFLAPLKADYPNLELIPIGAFDPENATLKAGK
jgi:zinc protease